MNLRTPLAAMVAAAVLVISSGCAVTRGQESTGAYIDDKAITATVKAKMIEDKNVDANAIKVDTLNGEVMLTGFAKNSVEKNTAESIAMQTKGVRIARKLDKMGMRSSDTAQIFFEDVRVPQRFLIGKEGEGFTYQMLQFQEERLYAAAVGLVTKERMIEETIAYTGQRQAFGQSILDNQVVHFRLAELKTEVEMLRALTYRAADLMLKGEDVTMLASMAKLKSGRLSREISDACLQYWGGMGFMNETWISRAYRDTRLGSIGGGADEVMLSIICKHMGILPGKRNK